MMENVIVEGVNIGLAFRDRFTQEMEQERGEIQAVIDGWGDAVESLNLEQDVGQS
jgi:phospholipid transport system substrate-binding protein